jgi:secreted trypsin-like serine protease
VKRHDCGSKFGRSIWMKMYWKLSAIGLAVILTLSPAAGIIGGDVAGPDEFPWEVALQKTGEDVAFCSGSHLGGGWIVTAAHCVDKKKAGDFNVFYGSNNLLSGGHKVPLTADPFVNDKWDPSKNYLNDIALIKIDPPADLPAARMILDAVEPPEIAQNAVLTISGWGLTNSAGPNNLDLRKANLTVGDQSACATAYAPEPISDAQVCVSSATAGGCRGDSGGAATGLDENGTVLVGVTNRAGTECAFKYPTVFSRITVYRPWIRGICVNSGADPASCPG